MEASIMNDTTNFGNSADTISVAESINQQQDAQQGLIYVSNTSLLITLIPVIAVACVSRYLGLELESPILVGSMRTFVQLSVLGWILKPIFAYGMMYWWIVALYVLFMILLASYESSNRSKYYIDHMFWYILGAYLFNLSVVSTYIFGFIISSNPLWDPHYVIPIIGMLLGNCINGVSLAANSFLSNLVEQSQEIEIYLSFGASKNEATERFVRDAIRAGAMPLLNTMAVIGLISIPGMMTGQILGGSPAMEAAHYQIFIIYLISVCTFMMMLAEITIIKRVIFDNRDVLLLNSIKKNDTNSVFINKIRNLMRFFSKKSGTTYSDLRESELPMSTSLSSHSVSSSSGKLNSYSEPNLIDFTCIRSGTNETVLRVESLYKAVGCKNNDTYRLVLEDVSLTLQQGGIISVTGPSGTGKSLLLRTIGGLNSLDGGDIFLEDNNGSGSISNSYKCLDARRWRQQVRYVQQSRLDIPGTPKQLMQRVTSLSSWKEQNSMPSYQQLTNDTRNTLRQWDMNIALLDEEWKSMSGGEAQRVYLAVCIASQPKIILLDEFTSALDAGSKSKVESTIQEMIANQGISIIIVSHDVDQVERLTNREIL